MDQVAQWLKDMGWKALWTLSVKTEVGGLSVGAAVLTRDLLALRIPEGGSVVSPARAVAAAFHPLDSGRLSSTPCTSGARRASVNATGSSLRPSAVTLATVALVSDWG